MVTQDTTITKTSYKVWLYFAVLALVILGPLLLRGYVLTLDMVFTPKLHMPGEVNNFYLFSALLHYLNYLLPSQIIQKIMLFLILELSGVGMYLLVSSQTLHLPCKNNVQLPNIGAYFAGIFYMVNPFTYTRFMAGHYLLLLGYAVLPFFVSALLRFFNTPNFKNAAKLAVFALIISIVSIHMIGFMAILGLAVCAASVIKQRRDKTYIKSILKYGIAALMVVLLLSSYWLVPFVRGTSSGGQLVHNIDSRHTEFFKTNGSGLVGVPFNVLGLYGFWGDRTGTYLLPKSQVILWPFLLLLLLALATIGAMDSWRQNRRRTAALMTSGAVAFVLAMGVAYGPVALLYRFLDAIVPLFAGYREPQKFVAIIALVLAYFGGIGVNRIVANIPHYNLKDIKLQVGTAALLLLPIFYTPTMLWGFSGQLKAAQYPADWYALNKTLDADRTNYQVLFLPWHQYMRFNFAGRVIANPAHSFFNKSVIQGDNAEFGTVFREVRNPVNEDIENSVLRPGDSQNNDGAVLARHQIKYIVLAKEVDWQQYGFLDHQTDIQLMSDTPTLRVYRNLSYEGTP